MSALQAVIAIVFFLLAMGAMIRSRLGVSFLFIVLGLIVANLIF